MFVSRRMRSCLLRSCSAIVLFAATAAPGQTSQPAQAPSRAAVEMLQKEARALEPLVQTEWVKQFLRGTARLPVAARRYMLKDDTKKVYFSRTMAMSLGAAYRETLSMQETTEIFYYYTKYGSPLAYARPLDVLGQAGFSNLTEKKILDFGFGTVGHLRLLAGLGASVVGVEVDPLLRALYDEPGDQGAIIGDNGIVGNLIMLFGRFPAEDRMKKEVGEGYDLIISKNTLKNGFIHPERKTEDRFLVKLGVSDEAFVKSFHDILKPGGLVLIYNICPAQAPPDKPFIPWADGRCPFPKSMWEAAGFEVVAFDKDDTAPTKNLAHALEWDKGEGAMNLEHDLFAHYTLLKKRSK